MALKLRIRQIRSTSGRKENQRLTLRALGIRRIDHTVEHTDTPQIRGMIFKIRHLVEVDEIRDK
jgi:large subunit ribosomal protein L30